MPAAAWSSCNEGIAAVPADSLVEGDHSIAVAVVAANRATAAKAKIIRRFMGSLPVECAPTSTLRASCPKSAVLGLYGGFSFADLQQNHTSIHLLLAPEPFTQPGRDHCAWNVDRRMHVDPAPRPPASRFFRTLHGLEEGALVVAFLVSMVVPLVDAIGRPFGHFSIPGSGFHGRVQWAWTLLLGGALLVFAAQVFAGQVDVVLAAALFAELLCIHRLWHRRTGRDEVLLLLLSLLLLCAGAALAAELAFGFAFLAFAISGTWALALTHLRSAIEAGRGPAGWVALLSSRRIATSRSAAVSVSRNGMLGRYRTESDSRSFVSSR